MAKMHFKSYQSYLKVKVSYKDNNKINMKKEEKKGEKKYISAATTAG